MAEIMQMLKKFKSYILLLFIAIIGMNGCSNYNNMATKNENVNEKWAQVENVYQRRSDLIPNLVEVVQGYAQHEQTTLTEVINARAKATSVTIDASKINPENIKQFEEAQSGLTQALSRLMVVSEKYPDLKANKNYQQLMTELAGTENRIAVERKAFNGAVQGYNKYIITFPRNFVAKMFGFEKRDYFKAEETAKITPKIKMTK